MDLEVFDIMGPSDTVETKGGECQDDTFVVRQSTATSADVPILCGQNTGQHSKICSHVYTHHTFCVCNNKITLSVTQ